jgi:1-deoxy-D-xylulose 5-phosphate reductoisomerase
MEIARIIEDTLGEVRSAPAHDLDAVIAADAEARRIASARLHKAAA